MRKEESVDDEDWRKIFHDGNSLVEAGKGEEDSEAEDILPEWEYQLRIFDAYRNHRDFTSYTDKEVCDIIERNANLLRIRTIEGQDLWKPDWKTIIGSA